MQTGGGSSSGLFPVQLSSGFLPQLGLLLTRSLAQYKLVAPALRKMLSALSLQSDHQPEALWGPSSSGALALSYGHLELHSDILQSVCPWSSLPDSWLLDRGPLLHTFRGHF